MRLDVRLLPLMLSIVLLGACTDTSGKRVDSAAAPDADQAAAFESAEKSRIAKQQQALWSALSDEEKSRVRAAAQAFSNLPRDKQEQLRSQYDALDDVTRRGYLLGPQLGEAWPHLQPVFGYVPETERAATLAMLRGLDREHLYALERVAWRTPVEDRDALRAKLFAMSPAQRNAWLFDQNQ
jgi:hypothetical protein